MPQHVIQGQQRTAAELNYPCFFSLTQLDAVGLSVHRSLLNGLATVTIYTFNP